MIKGHLFHVCRMDAVKDCLFHLFRLLQKIQKYMIIIKLHLVKDLWSIIKIYLIAQGLIVNIIFK
jgi:hypothetical protein